MKILVVDDDKIIREDLRNLIDWQSTNFELVAEASNGYEALEFVKSNSVDIIITDIYMPILNGVELIKAIKENNRRIQILVMSNYDDFAYVKDAMKYGALDYILKYKLNSDTLSALLETAAIEVKRTIEADNEREQLKKALLKEREQEYQTIWTKFLDQSYTYQQAAIKAKDLNMEFPEGDFIVILLKAEGIAKLSKQIICDIFTDTLYYIVETDKEEFLFLIHIVQKSFLYRHNKIVEIIRNISKAMQGSKFVITHSGEFVAVPYLPQEAAKLKKLSKLYFYNELDGFLVSNEKMPFNQDINVGILEDMEDQIIDAIKNVQRDKFIESLKSFVSEIRKNNYDPDLMINELKSMIQFIIKIIRSSHYYKDDILQALDVFLANLNNSFIRLSDIEAAFTDIFQKYFERLDTVPTDIFREEVSKAIKYIHENYKKNITLTELSEYVGISKNHLCMLFKQETGENFKEYVNKLKINEAKILISEKNYFIKEVAYEVGITNQRYFCKLFKEYTGSNPTDYKIRR